MILKEKGRRTCLIIICQSDMFCGWDVLYLLHQPASSWQVSQKPQKTSTKEAVFQQFKPRTPWTWCVTIKHHTTSRQSGVRTHYTVWSGRWNMPVVFKVFLGHFCVSVLTVIKLATLHLLYLERLHRGKQTEYTYKGGQTPSKQATASV